MLNYQVNNHNPNFKGFIQIRIDSTPYSSVNKKLYNDVKAILQKNDATTISTKFYPWTPKYKRGEVKPVWEKGYDNINEGSYKDGIHNTFVRAYISPDKDLSVVQILREKGCEAIKFTTSCIDKMIKKGEECKTEKIQEELIKWETSLLDDTSIY